MDHRIDYDKTGPHTFKVRSFSKLDDCYEIDLQERTCTCKAWEFGKRPCKHIMYVEIEEQRKTRSVEREPGEEPETDEN